MANCPNCGSPDIALKRETNVNWGRAVVGYAVFGVVGGAVGAVTGEDRNVNACLDCGTTWKAETLYQILQMIENTTNVKLDLSMEVDRTYLNQFMKEVSSFIEYVSRARSDAEKKFNESVAKESEGTIALGCTIPLAIGFSFLFFTNGFPFQSLFTFFISLVITIAPMFIALAIQKLTKKQRDKKAQKFKAIKENTVAEAENKLQWAISEFRDKYQR
jgi:ABC-type multidrug transport system fused ATPase/permease subunit